LQGMTNFGSGALALAGTMPDQAAVGKAVRSRAAGLGLGWRWRMQVFNLVKEQAWNPRKHVEKILGEVEEGDASVACWEPGQISPYHCHPQATEIYFCFEGGGKMRTPKKTVEVVPGSFALRPPGELHEYSTGTERT